MADLEEPSASRQYEKDGHTWSIGVHDDVSWIQRGLTRDTVTTAITAAIPPEFEAYATVALCEGQLGARTPTDPDAALFNVLQAHTGPQAWWLGYLETGASDAIFPLRLTSKGPWRRADLPPPRRSSTTSNSRAWRN